MRIKGQTVVKWLGYWLLYELLLLAGGALTFATIYVLVGLLPVVEMSTRDLVAKGLYHGAFMVGVVWGPGIAFVLCAMKAYRRKHSTSPDNLSGRKPA